MTATVTVLAGDMRDVLGKMIAEGEVVQSIVTDPPYGLAFMGRKWDAPDNVAFQPGTWRLCFDLLPPGGHLLAFAGTRTYHRMAVAIEEAGFEIRDTIAWLYGSGFPKSRNVSKAIDSEAGVDAEARGEGKRDEASGDYGMKNRCSKCGLPFFSGNPCKCPRPSAITDAARQWEGWGTALKPAMELICLARKPLDGTVAATVLKHGTGALNIDGCRVATDGPSPSAAYRAKGKAPSTCKPGEYGDGHAIQNRITPERWLEERPGEALGRWPANVCHDGSDEVVSAFPESGGGHHPAARGKGGIGNDGHSGQNGLDERFGDNGSAARFFYSSKADADDRLGSKHPTVKPVDLMRWLVRLVTPPPVLVCESCAKIAYDNSTKAPGNVSPLRDMPDFVQTTRQPSEASLLFEGLRGNGNAPVAETSVRTMRQGVQAGSGVEASPVLFAEMRDEVAGKETRQGICNDAARLHPALPPGSSPNDTGRLHNGASTRRGGNAGTTNSEERGSPPQERQQGGQPAHEPTSYAQADTRQSVEAAAEADHLSSLRGTDRGIRACSSCGGALIERRSVVLDPFAGSGTTGMACMAEGFDCILVEREAEYVADIKARIAHVHGDDLPLFSGEMLGDA